MTERGWHDYFEPGEKLLWEGAPLPGVHGLGKIIALAIFGLPFLFTGIGVLVSGIGSVVTGNVGFGLFVIAFSVPFAGVGALLVIGQWWAAANAHHKIRYALSTRAAYVAKSYWKRSIEAYPVLKSTASGFEKGRVSDTVWFHVRSDKGVDGDQVTTRIGFENIADGEPVFRMVRNLQMDTSA